MNNVYIVVHINFNTVHNGHKSVPFVVYILAALFMLLMMPQKI